MNLTYFSLLVAMSATAADVKLPAPFQTPNSTNRAQIVARPESAQLRVPQGFSVAEFASGLEKPRIMLEAPGGEILVSEWIANGRVTALAGKERKVLIKDLDKPYGMAFWKDYLYVAEATSLKRYKFDAKALSPGPGEEIVSMKDYTKGHVTRTIAFDKKGEKQEYGIDGRKS